MSTKVAAALDRQPLHPKYRPEIDGLRAVAVSSVLVFHAAPGRLPGGFVGVDIFFVISGYLITSIIVGGINSGRFSLKEFYARRVRRIFPALAVVLASSLLVGTLLFTDDELAALGKHVAAGAGFISNLVLWSEAGYFDSSANSKPLLHLWSLGVEEQFYIIWPAMLLLADRVRLHGRSFIAIVAILAALSFACSVHDSLTAPVAAYYSPLSRFWEPFIGALIAIAVRQHSLQLPVSLRDSVAWFGILLISLALVLVNSSRPYPGFWATLPTFGAAALILAGPEAWANKRLLANPVLVGVGLISYPLYLWHWPLIVFPRILEGAEVAQWKRLVAVIAAVPLAWLTYVAIERPMRFGALKRIATPLLCTVIGLLAAFGGWAWINNGVGPRPWAPRAVNAGEIGAPPYFAYVSAHYFPCTPQAIRLRAQAGEAFMRCPQSKPFDRRDIALIGDSHAEHLFPGLAEALPSRNVVAYGVGEGLPFISNADYAPVFNTVARSADIRSVVIAALWSRKLKPLDPKLWQSELIDTIQKLRAAGKIVYLADDVPAFSFQPNRCKFSGRLGAKVRCSQEDALGGYAYTEDFDKIARQTGARRINLHDAFCSQGKCSMARDGRLLYRDNHHLSIAGSRLAGAVIVRAMAAADDPAGGAAAQLGARR